MKNYCHKHKQKNLTNEKQTQGKQNYIYNVYLHKNKSLKTNDLKLINNDKKKLTQAKQNCLLAKNI